MKSGSLRFKFHNYYHYAIKLVKTNERLPRKVWRTDNGHFSYFIPFQLFRNNLETFEQLFKNTSTECK